MWRANAKGMRHRYTVGLSAAARGDFSQSREADGIPEPRALRDSADQPDPAKHPVPDAASETSFRPLGAILGWVFPGLGHIAAGNAKRGIMAMAGVLLLFFGGLLVGGVDCVDRTEDRLWFFGQACCGPIAFAADKVNEMQLKSGAAAPLIETASYPGQPKVFVSPFKGIAHANEFGTLFVFLAGLLNICVLLDAAVRPPSSDGPSSGRRAVDGGAA